MKILRKILKGLSLTAALFVFQACYGTPQVNKSEEQVEGEESAVAEDVAMTEVMEDAATETLPVPTVPQ